MPNLLSDMHVSCRVVHGHSKPTHCPIATNGACLLPAQGKVKWAIAGRNAARLEEVKQELIRINPSCKVCLCELTFTTYALSFVICARPSAAVASQCSQHQHVNLNFATAGGRQTCVCLRWQTHLDMHQLTVPCNVVRRPCNHPNTAHHLVPSELATHVCVCCRPVSVQQDTPVLIGDIKDEASIGRILQQAQVRP